MAALASVGVATLAIREPGLYLSIETGTLEDGIVKLGRGIAGNPVHLPHEGRTPDVPMLLQVVPELRHPVGTIDDKPNPFWVLERNGDLGNVGSHIRQRRERGFARGQYLASDGFIAKARAPADAQPERRFPAGRRQ